MKINFKIPLSQKKYLRYSLIGILLIFIFFLISNYFISQKEYFHYIYAILITTVLWLGCSVIIYFIEQKYTWDKHAIKRLMIELPSIIIYAVLVHMFFAYVSYKNSDLKVDWEQIRADAVFIAVFTILILAIAESVDLFQAWKQSLLKSKELEIENIEAQYLTLKSQVNPHFLFNSLNTLANYVQENPQATEYLEKLSEYLRYTMVLKNNKLTTIKEELDIINKYFFIQKSRFGSALELKIDISQSILIEKGSIPPFSLQILLENAIKHNVISKNKPLIIEVFSENKNRIVVLNNLQIKEVLNSTQIGQKNIIDRYRFLTDQEVIIDDINEEYKVSLPIIYSTENQ